MSTPVVHCLDHTLDPTTIRSIIGSLNYSLCMIIGNFMYIGIIDFEKWGGDPMRRTVLNQLTSLACGSILVLVTWTGSIYQWIIIYGPSGPRLASWFVLSRKTFSLLVSMSVLEHILIQLLVVYKWNRVVLHDNFLARFLYGFNLMISLLFGAAIYGTDMYRSKNYALLSCREPGLDPTRWWLLQSTLIVFAALGYASLKYRKRQLNRDLVVPFHDSYENEPIMSTGELVFHGMGFYFLTFPFLLMSPLIFDDQGQNFAIRYREIIILLYTNILCPIFVYYKNQNLRNHVKERLIEICS